MTRRPRAVAGTVTLALLALLLISGPAHACAAPVAVVPGRGAADGDAS
jgi:hypothetical protein